MDTGSESTPFLYSIVDKSAIQDTTEKITAANHTEIPILGKIVLPIQIGEFKSTIRGLVSDHVAEIMMGMDWLSANDISWKFGEKQIRIRGKKHDISGNSRGERWCR